MCKMYILPLLYSLLTERVSTRQDRMEDIITGLLSSNSKLRERERESGNRAVASIAVWCGCCSIQIQYS